MRRNIGPGRRVTEPGEPIDQKKKGNSRTESGPICAEPQNQSFFNNDCLAVNDLRVWPFSASELIVRRIRQTYPWSVIHATSNRDEGGDYSGYVVVRGGGLLVLCIVTALAAVEPLPPLTDGGQCREMAGKLRELARRTRSPGIRRELVDLARRYDRRGDHFDGRSR
jgi:hypothetical protein